MKKPRFLRSDTVRHKRLGSHRRTLQKWRRPRGRHSKIRRHRFSYPRAPSVGYKKPRAEMHTFRGRPLVLVTNLKELEHAEKNAAVIIAARLGAKKRLELIKRAHEKGLFLTHVESKDSGGNHGSR